jgi:hypothetical protein
MGYKSLDMDKIELPPSWKVVKLGEISKVTSGGTPVLRLFLWKTWFKIIESLIV